MLFVLFPFSILLIESAMSFNYIIDLNYLLQIYCNSVLLETPSAHTTYTINTNTMFSRFLDICKYK